LGATSFEAQGAEGGVAGKGRQPQKQLLVECANELVLVLPSLSPPRDARVLN